MEPTLTISILMLLVIVGSCLYMMTLLADCKKIIKKYKKSSRNYMRKVVSK
jgi:hypothetical protein